MASAGNSSLVLLVCCSQMAPGARGIRRCPTGLEIQDGIFPYRSDLLHEACSPRVSIPETKAEAARLLMTQPQKTCSISCTISYLFQENQSPNPDSRGQELTRAWILKDVIHCGTFLNTSCYQKKFLFHFYAQEKSSSPLWSESIE